MTKLQETKMEEITKEYTARGMTVVDETVTGGHKSLKVTGIDNKHPELGEIRLNITIRYHSLDVNRIVSQGNWQHLHGEKF